MERPGHGACEAPAQPGHLSQRQDRELHEAGHDEDQARADGQGSAGQDFERAGTATRALLAGEALRGEPAGSVILSSADQKVGHQWSRRNQWGADVPGSLGGVKGRASS